MQFQPWNKNNKSSLSFIFKLVSRIVELNKLIFVERTKIKKMVSLSIESNFLT